MVELKEVDQQAAEKGGEEIREAAEAVVVLMEEQTAV